MLFKPLDARQIHLVLLSQKMPPSPLAAVGTGRGNRASPPTVPQASSVPRKVLPSRLSRDFPNSTPDGKSEVLLQWPSDGRNPFVNPL